MQVIGIRIISSSIDGGVLQLMVRYESLTWNHSDSRFQFSDDLHIVGNITVTGNVDGIDILVQPILMM